MTSKTKFLGVTLVAIFILTLGYAYTVDSNNKQITTEHHEDDDDAVEEYEIYPGDLVERMQTGEKVILLDVRTKEEHEIVHLENSLLLPVQNMSQQSLTSIGLGPNAKDKEIFVYCRSGNRSKTAYDIMTSLGYTNVKSVAGGMVHWEEDEYPLTKTGAHTGSAEAAIPVASATGPKLSLDRIFHDFGVIPQYGGTVSTTFEIQNTGTETLVLGDITTSCSCTSASASSQSIAPNQTAQLTLIFDPDFHEEPFDVFKRTVFIPTNDPQSPEAELVMQVDIIEGK